ncbi:MAG: glycine zipper 2TM domain-containing protein [Pseudomonadota bacterium]
MKLTTIAKPKLGVAALALGLAMSATIAVAGGYSRSSYSDHAVVTHVEPIYRTVRISEPHQECWQEEVYHNSHSHGHSHSAGSTIVGGIIGGVIGHKVGKSINGSKGKHSGAILGTLIGAAVGNEHAHNRKKRHGHGGYTTVQNHCQTVHTYHTEERIDAYRVTYEYNGQIFYTRMKHRPGDRIRVNIHVTPSAY